MHDVARICAATLPFVLAYSTVSAQTPLILTIDFKHEEMKNIAHFEQVSLTTNAEVPIGSDGKHRLDISGGKQYVLVLQYKTDPHIQERFDVREPNQPAMFEVQDALFVLELTDKDKDKNCLSDRIKKIHAMTSISKLFSARMLRATSRTPKEPCADPENKILFVEALKSGRSEFIERNRGFILSH